MGRRVQVSTNVRARVRASVVYRRAATLVSIFGIFSSMVLCEEGRAEGGR